MAKKVFWETVKTWSAGVGAAGGTLAFLLFAYLTATGAIIPTGHSGDMVCAGTVADPCIAYINFTAMEDIFVYPSEYDPYGRNSPIEFDKKVKGWIIQRSWGDGWRSYDLTTNCKGTWCGAPDNSGDTKYSLAWRKGKEYQLKVVVYKNDPKEDIKWGAFDVIDPIFYGFEGYNITINDMRICTNTSHKLLTWKPENITKIYTCPGKSKITEGVAVCEEYYAGNDSTTVWFNGTANSLKNDDINYTMVIYSWKNTTIVNEICTGAKKLQINVSTLTENKTYECNYTAWGKCSYNVAKGKIECDSKYDGDSNGTCTSGESCITLEATDKSITYIKKSTRDLGRAEFEVICETK